MLRRPCCLKTRARLLSLLPLLPKQEWSAGRRQRLARPHTDLARARPRAAGLPSSGKPYASGVANPAREARAPSCAKGLRLPALHRRTLMRRSRFATEYNSVLCGGDKCGGVAVIRESFGRDVWKIPYRSSDARPSCGHCGRIALLQWLLSSESRFPVSRAGHQCCNFGFFETRKRPANVDFGIHPDSRRYCDFSTKTPQLLRVDRTQRRRFGPVRDTF